MKVVYTEKGAYLCESVDETPSGGLHLDKAFLFDDEGRRFTLCHLSFGVYIQEQVMGKLTTPTINGDFEYRDLLPEEIAAQTLAQTVYEQAGKYAALDMVNRYYRKILKGK